MMMVHSHYTHMTRACMQSSVQTSGREFYKKTTLAEPKQQFYLTLTQHNKNTTLCRNSKLKKYHRQVISNDMKIVYTIFECISLGNSYFICQRDPRAHLLFILFTVKFICISKYTMKLKTANVINEVPHLTQS